MSSRSTRRQRTKSNKHQSRDNLLPITNSSASQSQQPQQYQQSSSISPVVGDIGESEDGDGNKNVVATSAVSSSSQPQHADPSSTTVTTTTSSHYSPAVNSSTALSSTTQHTKHRTDQHGGTESAEMSEMEVSSLLSTQLTPRDRNGSALTPTSANQNQNNNTNINAPVATSSSSSATTAATTATSYPPLTSSPDIDTSTNTLLQHQSRGASSSMSESGPPSTTSIVVPASSSALTSAVTSSAPTPERVLSPTLQTDLPASSATSSSTTTAPTTGSAALPPRVPTTQTKPATTSNTASTQPIPSSISVPNDTPASATAARVSPSPSTASPSTTGATSSPHNPPASPSQREQDRDRASSTVTVGEYTISPLPPSSSATPAPLASASASASVSASVSTTTSLSASPLSSNPASPLDTHNMRRISAATQNIQPVAIVGQPQSSPRTSNASAPTVAAPVSSSSSISSSSSSSSQPIVTPIIVSASSSSSSSTATTATTPLPPPALTLPALDVSSPNSNNLPSASTASATSALVSPPSRTVSSSPNSSPKASPLSTLPSSPPPFLSDGRTPNPAFLSTGSLVLANGKPNKALISARQAFLKKNSIAPGSDANGSTTASGATSPTSSLIPGINDGPTSQRLKQHRTHSMHMTSLIPGINDEPGVGHHRRKTTLANVNGIASPSASMRGGMTPADSPRNGNFHRPGHKNTHSMMDLDWKRLSGGNNAVLALQPLTASALAGSNKQRNRSVSSADATAALLKGVHGSGPSMSGLPAGAVVGAPSSTGAESPPRSRRGTEAAYLSDKRSAGLGAAERGSRGSSFAQQQGGEEKKDGDADGEITFHDMNGSDTLDAHRINMPLDDDQTGSIQSRPSSSAASATAAAAAKKRAEQERKQEKELARQAKARRHRHHTTTNSSSSSTWSSIRTSLLKSRSIRPVIGGKFSYRPTLDYFPLPYANWLYLLHDTMHSVWYQLVMIFLIIVSVFATDFTFAFLSKSMDLGTSLLLFILLLLFCVDSIMTFLLHSNYFCSIYSYFDVLTILSLVVDISYLTGDSDIGGTMNNGWNMAHNEHSWYALSVSHASLNTVSQISYILSVLRLLKLVRPVNFLHRRYQKSKYAQDEERRCLGMKNGTGGVNGEQQQNGYERQQASADTFWSNPFFHTNTAASQSSSSWSTSSVTTPPPSQLGTILFDSVSIRNMILIVLLGCALPIITLNMFGNSVSQGYQIRQNGLHTITNQFTSLSSSSSSTNDALQIQDNSAVPMNSAQQQVMPYLYDSFVKTHSMSGSTNENVGEFDTTSSSSSANGRLLYLELNLYDKQSSVKARTIYHDFDTTSTSISSLRSGLEYQIFTSQSTPYSLNTASPSVVFSTTAYFDTKKQFQKSAWLHLIMMLTLIVLYLVSTFTLIQTISQLVIQPFERIVAVIWKLTKSLGIVKDDSSSTRKVYGKPSSSSNPHDSVDVQASATKSQQLPDEWGVILHPPAELTMSQRFVKDLKSTFLPMTLRPYEIRIIDDLISKLCRIFDVTPISRTTVLTSTIANAAAMTNAASGASNGVLGSKPSFSASAFSTTPYLSKSLRLLTGTRVTEIQTPNTILTVTVVEKPLEKELIGVRGTPTQQPTTRTNRGSVAAAAGTGRAALHHQEDPYRHSISISANGTALPDETTPVRSVAGRKSDRYSGGAVPFVNGGSDKSAGTSATSSPTAVTTAAANGTIQPSDHVGSAGAQHAAVLSNLHSGIVASAHGAASTSPTTSPPTSPRRSLLHLTTKRQSSKAAFLLGVASTKHSTGSRHELLIKEGHVDERDHPELVSLDALLLQPLALTHFRSFLISKHSIEIFLFYIQVLKYQQDFLQKASFIYSQFIAIGGAYEVNIPSQIRDDISASLHAPSYHLFEQAKVECCNLLRGSFQEFMQSEAALNYLTQKIQDRIVLKGAEEMEELNNTSTQTQTSQQQQLTQLSHQRKVTRFM